MVSSDRTMTMMVAAILVAFIALLVFLSGWRICPPQSAIAGGVFSLLLFLLHPALLSGIQNSSPWDALFVMLFVSAWLWMEHWSLFMRSWVLAVIFAFGLWVGSPFVLWGLIAMVPWVIFNRRPLPAVGSLLTVFLGGLFLFSVSWGAAWFFIPNLGRPLFTQWIRWGGLKFPPAISLSWWLLVLGVVAEQYRQMFRDRRSDASIFIAVLLGVSALLGSSNLRLGLIALAAPLIARALVKREFLYNRGIRWLASLTFIVVMLLAFGLKIEAWKVTALGMLAAGFASRGLKETSRLSWVLMVEALCIGSFAAEFLGTVLHLYPA